MPQKFRIGADVYGALGVAFLLSCACILIGDVLVGLGLCVIIVPALIYAASRVPVRMSLMVLMWFALVLPNPSDGIMNSKDWDPPLMRLGALLLDHLNVFDRQLFGFASFSGMDLCFVTLGIIAWMRNSSGSTIDRAGRLPTPQPLLKLAYVALGSIAFVWLYGMVTGGDFKNSLWQINAVIYTPIVFLLFQYALRGPADYRAFAIVLLSAAVYKSLLAVWVFYNIHEPPDPYTGLITRVAYATCHADSIVFADATLLVIALLLEGQKIKLLAAILLPIYAGGMIANNRRLVWVQVALVLLTVFIISKDNPLKRKLRRGLTFAAPVLAVYLAAGWNSTSGGTFKPVRMIRSVVDAKSDSSSFWRELENFNLLADWMSHPIFGSGFGHEYTEYVEMPVVDYTLERYVPHNSIFGLWSFCGLVGYAGLTLLWAGGVYFAMRAYYHARTGPDRAASLVCFGAVLVWLMMCFGDLGVGLWAGVFTVAPAFALSGKLAVASGEWPGGPTQRKGPRPVAA